MAIGGYVAAETLLPVPGMNGIAAQGGLIALLYMTMIPSLGLALGVGQCANPNGSIGISRALTAMLAYDVPLVIVIFGVATHYGTINLVDMIAIQQAGGPATWGVTQMPLLAVAGLFALQGMLGKQPFEIYVAPAEIATGPMVEMGGKFLGGLFVMQCFQLYTGCGALRDPVSGRRGELGDLPAQELRGVGHPHVHRHGLSALSHRGPGAPVVEVAGDAGPAGAGLHRPLGSAAAGNLPGLLRIDSSAR